MSKEPKIKANVDAAKVAPGTHDVAIATVVADPSWQIRQSLNEQAIKQMANVLRGGDELPPVKIIRVEGVPFLADGWHRREAHLRLNKSTVKAEIVEGTATELRSAALLANLQHGVRLKSKELRDVFRGFIRNRQHRKNGDLMSYRDISRALHGAVSYGTVRIWMEKDFPRIFAEMKNDEGDREGQGESFGTLIAVSKSYGRAAFGSVNAARQYIQNFDPVDDESWQTLWREVKILEAEIKQRYGKPYGDEWDQSLEKEAENSAEAHKAEVKEAGR